MATTSIDPTQSAAGDALQATLTASSPSKTLGKDQFLQLLVSQLQHQDPLNPADDKEFVAQMATFSSLEQLVNANKNLEGLALGQANLINSQALNLIGKEALVPSDGTIRVQHGTPDTLAYQLPKAATSATLTIVGPDGAPVKVFELDKTATGRVTLAWDGKDAQGHPVADGSYHVEVHATDTDGQAMQVAVFRSLPIQGVEFGSGGISLISGDTQIPFDQIVEISAGHS